MLKTIINDKVFYVIATIYILLVIWWINIYSRGATATDENYYFGFAYALIALIGGLYGMFLSRKWGGFKSAVGKGMIFFSLGLLSLCFGQMAWTYYNVIARIDIPYPSIADIGYFSIIPLYAVGIVSFAKASGVTISFKSIKGKLISLVIPLLMVLISYYLFLKDFTPDFSQPVRTFLDFGYPFGEAITISLALVTYALSLKLLGGKMKNRILYLIFALVFQYITDYIYIYMVAQGTYINGGIVDLLYTTSFTIMSIGLISFKSYE